MSVVCQLMTVFASQLILEFQLYPLLIYRKYLQHVHDFALLGCGLRHEIICAWVIPSR
jgi:hypothetical protein